MKQMTTKTQCTGRQVARARQLACSPWSPNATVHAADFVKTNYTGTAWMTGIEHAARHLGTRTT